MAAILLQRVARMILGRATGPLFEALLLRTKLRKLSQPPNPLNISLKLLASENLGRSAGAYLYEGNEGVSTSFIL